MNEVQTSAAPIGVVEEVSGPVVDIACSGALPGMHDALSVELDGGECVLEVRHHLDARRLRAVALHSTAGMRRGSAVYSTGGPLRVPVAQACLGRVLD
ncbi:MAG: F0F1 ATP synthase subunit beta, partial [Burkholderiales bacterium]